MPRIIGARSRYDDRWQWFLVEDHKGRRRPRPWLLYTWPLVFLAALVAALAGAGGGAPALAQSSTINVIATDAVSEATIPNFKWTVNLDNSHDAASLEPPAS